MNAIKYYFVKGITFANDNCRDLSVIVTVFVSLGQLDQSELHFQNDSVRDEKIFFLIFRDFESNISGHHRNRVMLRRSQSNNDWLAR